MQHKKHRRKGSVYIAVMGVAMIVAVVGLASIQIATIELHASRANHEMADAQLAAQSAVEFALGNIELNGSSWRDNYTSGEEVPNASWHPLGTRAEFKIMLVDDDGDLADDPRDMVTIRGIGRAGDATSVVSVAYAPDGAGLTCLSASLHAGGTFETNKQVTTNQEISSNSNIDIYGAGLLTGDAWAVGPIDGKEAVSGTALENQSPPREMPDPASVFDYYLVNGTPIDIDDLSHGNKIADVVLSPTHNPYGSGATNPLGIYIIDCEGKILTICHARLEATLVILNQGVNTVRLEHRLHWEPAVENFPAMLVEGDVWFDWSWLAALQESGHANFNPPESPYPGPDDYDSDQDDIYPSIIKGLIYISGNLEITDHCKLEGVVVVGGGVASIRETTLSYRDLYFTNPPPGFSSGTSMQLVPGSWTREAY